MPLNIFIRYIIFMYTVQGVTEDAGRIGLVIVLSGMVGSMICGIVLDKTHQYKVKLKVQYVALNKCRKQMHEL